MNDKYWYNIKQENGVTVIEKVNADGYVEQMNNNPPAYNQNYNYNYNYQNKPKKKSKSGLIVCLCLVLLIVGFVFFYTGKKILRNTNMKNRTFMIYMVGSDLESKSSMATFDLSDINGTKIDLENNNVILMVGGSKQWHNFVNVDEIGIYELTKNGFNKIKSLPVSSMGTASSLETFLDYSYDQYPAKKYDLIFWNHGLGALGLEDDELTSDFLDIKELSKAFSKSPFKKEKLELVIFNNCLAGNIHFASVMSDYAEYMVGSEEIMYVGLMIDRLNFLENVKESDDGYAIGKLYIDKSDESMKRINPSSYTKYDSTLSIIDLKNLKNLEKEVNAFFESINLNGNYNNVARARMKTYTYARKLSNLYDTVDLYELIDALEPYSSKKSLATSVKNEIKNTVKYNSSLNNHSNGISIYFPYYGSYDYISAHLYYFSSMWSNGYVNFINNFSTTSYNAIKARRAVTGNDVNILTNSVNVNGNTISIQLSDEESEIYQRANIYVFNKKGNRYELLLKSNNVSLDNNTLKYNHYGVLKTDNGYNATLINEDDYLVYETNDGIDLITYISFENGAINYINSFVDSGDKPSNAIYERDENKSSSMYLYSYELEDLSDWKDTLEKEKIEIDNNNLVINEKLNGYYVLVEMYDLNNDVFYSEIKNIK